MPEVTDTRQPIFPAGERIFTVSKPAVKKVSQSSGKPYYVFEFECLVDGKIEVYREMVMPWMSGPLLKAFGCKEKSPNVFEWEKDEIVGKKIKATIVHEPDRKEPTKMRCRMTNPVEELPF